MAVELCYTSAPSGLAPGSRGFCTVAATRGISAPLVERLEALSGYRPLQGGHNGDPRVHPVNWSHRELTLGGHTYSILSRIAFAGADYTQRSNKLAHHVALREHERPPAGPAWVLQQPGIMREAWRDEPTLFPHELHVPWGEMTAAPCRAWAQAAGDAAWGGVLAEAFVLDRSCPAYVIYRPEKVDPLALVAEAMALLSPAMRWQVHFSTYFTDLPAGLPCHWRFVVAGTPAAEQARHANGDVLCIDLDAPGRIVRQTRYTQWARTGELPADGAEAEPALAHAYTGAEAAAGTASRAAASSGGDGEGYELAIDEPPRNKSSSSRPRPSTRRPVEAGGTVKAPAASSRGSGQAARWWTAIAAAGVLGGAAGYWVGAIQPTSRGADADLAEHAALETSSADRARIDELEREIVRLRQQMATAPAVNDQAAQVSSVADPVPPVPLAATAAPAAPPEPPAPPDVPAPSDASTAPAPAVSSPAIAPGPAVTLLPTVEGRFIAPLEGGGSEMGDTSSQPPARVLLTGLPAPPEASVRVLSPIDAGAGLPWRFVTRGSDLDMVYEEVDALGIPRQRTVAQAGIVGQMLTWRWNPHAIPFQARRGGEAARLMRYSVLQVLDAGSQVRGEVQFLRPQSARIAIGAPVIPLEHDWPDAMPRLVLHDGPTSWASDISDDGTRITLRSKAGAVIELMLLNGNRPAFSARWGRGLDPASLVRRREGLQQEVAADADLVASYDALQRDLSAAKASLPVDEDGHIDVAAAGQRPHREAYQAYQRVQEQMNDLAYEHADRDLADVSARHAAARQDLSQVRARLSDIDDLTALRCLVIASRSSAVLAEVEVQP